MGTIVEEWVEEQARLTKPDKVYWMQGTEEEMRRLVDIGIREEKIGDHHTFRPSTRASSLTPTSIGATRPTWREPSI